MSLRRFAIPILGLAVAGIASATTTFYTNQSAFNAGTAGLSFQTANFAGDTFGLGGVIDTPTGFTFQDQNGGSSELTCPNSCSDAGALKVTSGFQLNILQPPGATAFWFDILTVNNGASVNVSSSSPSSFTPFTTTGAAGTPFFFGVVTDTSIAGLQITGSPGNVEFDNFNNAGSTATPEAGTITLMGGGLTLLRLLGVRRRRRS
jgi:hypothetical protein